MRTIKQHGWGQLRALPVMLGVLFIVMSIVPVMAQGAEEDDYNVDSTPPAELPDTVEVPAEITTEQEDTFAELFEDAQSVDVVWDETTTVPDFVKPANLELEWTSDDYVDRAIQYLETYKELYQIEDSLTEFESGGVSTDDETGITNVTLNQYVEGVPVQSKQLKVHFAADNTVRRAFGSYIPQARDVSTTPTVLSEDAVQTALDSLQTMVEADDDAWATLQVENTEPELVLYNAADSEDVFLTWKVDVSLEEAVMNWRYYIDAGDGTVESSYNRSSNLRDRATYLLDGCSNFIGELLYDEQGLIDGKEPNVDTESVHNYVGNAYDYFFDTFSRDSYDNQGSVIESRSNYKNPYNLPIGNICIDEVIAAWNPDVNSMYFAKGVYSDDIMAHELTHGILFDEISLDNEDLESNSLHEGYSDIFGILAERHHSELDWNIGEDLVVNRDDCVIGLRDLRDPESHTNTCSGIGTNLPDNTSDGYSTEYEGGSIFGHAFYLLVTGDASPHNSESVDISMDIDDAEQLYYKVITGNYLDSNATLESAYRGTVEACLDMHIADSTTYPLTSCEAVFQAFKIVGIHDDASFIDMDISASPPEGVEPLIVTFSAGNTFTLNSNITNYHWDFGDGTLGNDGELGVDTGTTSTVEHTYATKGDYIATLTVTDSEGQQDSIQYHMLVLDGFDPAFETVRNSWAVPATVQFDASTTSSVKGTVTNYTWDFGDGSAEVDSGTDATVEHEFTTAGVYDVTLTVEDSNGLEDTVTIPVELYSSIATGTEVTGDITTATWTTTNSPYIIDGTATIPSDQTLTIDPGVVVKFKDSTSKLIVNGTLTAEGTVTDEILFTSYADDTVALDTNGDGDQTAPATGDWEQVEFTSGSTASLDYVHMRYGGKTSGYISMVDILSDDVVIDNSEFTDSAGHTIYVDASSPIITNSLLGETDSVATALWVNSGSPSLLNSTIQNAGYGVYIVDGSPTITNNTITDNRTIDVQVFSNNATPTITNNTFGEVRFVGLNTDTVFTGNIDGNLYIEDTTYGNATLDSTANSTRYIMEGLVVDADDTLTIAAGSTIYMDQSGSERLDVFGTLTAIGTDLNPITFTPENQVDPQSGDWNQVLFLADSVGTLQYVTMEYGGDSSTDLGMVGILSDTVTISNSTFTNSDWHTIYIDASSPSITESILGETESIATAVYVNSGNPTITNSVIHESGYGVYVRAGSPTFDGNTIANNRTIDIQSKNDAASPIITDNTVGNVRFDGLNTGTQFSGNTGDDLYISGTTYGDATLDSTANTMQYILEAFTVPSTDTLTLAAGTTLYMDESSSTTLTVNGTLTAEGNEVTPITLTPEDQVDPQPGNWRQVIFAAGSTGTLEYVTMEYGGSDDSGNQLAMVDIFSDNVTISNSTFTNSDWHTLYMDSTSLSITNSTIADSTSIATGLFIQNGSPTVTNSIIRDVNYGVYVANGSPVITDTTFLNNATYAIYNADTTNTISAENNNWNSDTEDDSGPTHADNPTGTGDTVSDNVDYDPWYTIPPVIIPLSVDPVEADVWAPQVDLTWTNPINDTTFDHIRVKRKNITDDTSEIVLDYFAGTSYTDTTLEHDKKYKYIITSRDVDGTVITKVTTDRVKLKNPASARVRTILKTNKIVVRWRASSAPEETVGGYSIHYGTSPDALDTVVDVGENRVYKLLEPIEGTTYYFGVVTYDTTGAESPMSEVVSVTW